MLMCFVVPENHTYKQLHNLTYLVKRMTAFKEIALSGHSTGLITDKA